MRKIRDVLRYRHSTDLSLEAISRSLNIFKGVVAKYVRLAADAGLTRPLAFCTRYRAWAGKLKRSMRQVHRTAQAAAGGRLIHALQASVFVELLAYVKGVGATARRVRWSNRSEGSQTDWPG
jgi:hypothetical protein